MSLGVWLGLGVFCSLAIAQPVQGPQFPSPAGKSTNQPGERYYFGVMGQIARPGVYELDNPQPELVELLRHAGGLTQQATGRIRIVREGHAGEVVSYSPTLYFPLISGDIIVADVQWPSQLRSQITPRSSSAIRDGDSAETSASGNADALRHVAMVNVLDRPVILPVPQTHANLTAIIAYLGQHPAVASIVNILPVGPEAASKPFVVPTVLSFDPQVIRRDRLPELPGVWRVGVNGEIIPPTTDAPAKRFQPLQAFVAPDPLIDFPTPPIAKIPSPASIPTIEPEQEASDGPAKNSEADSEPKNTAWWTYAGLVLLVLLPLGTYAGRRWKRSLPDSSLIEEPPAALPLPPRSVVPAEPAISVSRPPVQTAGKLMEEEILEALMFDRWPVFEESTEAPPAEQKEEPPPSQKRFRLDPPEAQATAVKRPYLQTPAPQPSLTNTEPPESPPTLPLPQNSPLADRGPQTLMEENRPVPGLLDRVLQRVHQNRAA
jgi:hypothetical protein